MACLHDHSCEDHNCSSDWSLYQHVDLPKVKALNESVAESVKSVFKAWEHRLNNSEGFLESNEGDPELLVYIPFTSDVKIKSISIVGGAGGTSPSKMRAFINRDGIDFSDAQSMQPVQEWELAENLQGVLEYQTRYSRFQSVANLTLHFPDNFGGETTQIYYIGLRGEATQLKRDMVAKIVYEVMPNPSDHKTPNDAGKSDKVLTTDLSAVEGITYSCQKRQIMACNMVSMVFNPRVYPGLAKRNKDCLAPIRFEELQFRLRSWRSQRLVST